MVSVIEKWLEGRLNQDIINNLNILMALLLQLAGLTFAVSVDSYISRKHRRVMRIIIVLALALIVQNYAEYLLASEGTGMPRIFYRTIAAACGYCIRPAILLAFFYVVDPGRRYVPARILAGINAAVYMTALLGSHLCFYIGQENRFHRGPLSRTCLYVSIAFLVYLLYLTARKYRDVRKREAAILLFIVLMLAVSMMLDGSVGKKEQVVQYITITSVSGSVFFYIWLHLQFVREHEKALKDGQRVQMMLSQIKPHFLYNSLGAIEELCDSDPQAARAATVTFSRYLRGNMSSISADGAIPFERELSHTKFYLELERLRFEDALRVEYDISCTDFMIPTLTLEPLVENAVRHGVRGREDGSGTVTISTREYPDHFEVSVADDGPGFDPEAAPGDGHPHVGLQNVRERLTQVCGGTLQIESFPGRGTTAVIILPKRKGDI